MDGLSKEEIERRAEAYPRLVDALLLTTSALMRADNPGAKHRVEESTKLLKSLGERAPTRY